MPKPVILERRLVEAESVIITNPQVAATVGEEYAARVKDAPFKDFLKRRVRQALLRQTGLHVPVGYDQAQAMHGSETLPPYILQAMQERKPLYMISLTSEAMTSFKQTIEHLVDWFNAMSHLLQQEVNAGNQVALEDNALTKKAIGNLQNQTIEQAIASSEKWFARMGARVRGSKSDVIVMKRWPDGYYAVQFKPTPDGLKAMQSDGNDLQNCLRYGNYTQAVQSGNSRVYAIRKPNDEAVVGIALTRDGSVQECKGKNNKTVAPQYTGYCADFLTAIKAKPPEHGSYDLSNADIEFQNGRFFIFQNDATQLLDQPHVKVWKNNHMALIDINGTELRVGIEAGHLTVNKKTTLPQQATDAFRERTFIALNALNMLIALNALNMPPNDELAERLSRHADIHYGDNRYAGFNDVANVIFEQGNVTVRRTKDEVRIWAGGNQIGFMLKDNRLDRMSAFHEPNDFPDQILASVLTAIKLAPTAEGLKMMSNERWVDYKDGRWGKFEDIARTLYERNGFKVLGSDSRIYYTHERVTLRGELYGGALAELHFSKNSKYANPGGPGSEDDAAAGVTPEQVIAMLNTVKIPPATFNQQDINSVGPMLFDAGIVFTGREYAPLLEASEVLFQHGNVKLFKVHTVANAVRNSRNNVATKFIVVDDRKLWKPPTNRYGTKNFLDKVLNYVYYGWDHGIIRLVGRKAFVKMANSTKLPYESNGGSGPTLPDLYGIDVRGGAGNFKLAEEGKKQIAPYLYQVTKNSWLLAPENAEVVLFKLRAGTLTATRPPYHDTDENEALYARSVQVIAQNNHVMNSPDGEVGILDPGKYNLGNEKPTATFEHFVERLKAMPDAAYLPFMNDENETGLRRFISGLGKLTKLQQAALYAATKAKAPYFEVEPGQTYKIAGMTIQDMTIRLPAAWVLFRMGNFHPEIAERVRTDVEKSLPKVLEYMNKEGAATGNDRKVFTLMVGHIKSHVDGHMFPAYRQMIDRASEIRETVYKNLQTARDADENEAETKRLKDYTEAQIMDRYRSWAQAKKFNKKVTR